MGLRKRVKKMGCWLLRHHRVVTVSTLCMLLATEGIQLTSCIVLDVLKHVMGEGVMPIEAQRNKGYPISR